MHARLPKPATRSSPTQKKKKEEKILLQTTICVLRLLSKPLRTHVFSYDVLNQQREAAKKKKLLKQLTYCAHTTAKISNAKRLNSKKTKEKEKPKPVLRKQKKKKNLNQYRNQQREAAQLKENKRKRKRVACERALRQPSLYFR